MIKRFERYTWARGQLEHSFAEVTRLKTSCRQRVTYKSPLSDITPFLWDQRQRSVFCNFFMQTQGTVFLKQKMLTRICGLSLLIVLVACLHISTEQAAITLMPTGIQIIRSSSVNPILLRPVLGIMLTTVSLLLKSEQFMLWLRSGHHDLALSLWRQLQYLENNSEKCFGH